jgi:hypothetical protein
MKAFDCNFKLTGPVLAAAFKQGYKAVGRYVGRRQMASFDIDTTELKLILDNGFKVFLVQHCEKPGWIATEDLGREYGRNAVTFAQSVGYDKGCIIYLDLEGVLKNCTPESIIRYCKAWREEVLKYYTPGLYVGYDSGLTSDQLQSLNFKSYWRSASNVPDLKLGYAMQQQPQIKMYVDYVDPNEVSDLDKITPAPYFMSNGPAARIIRNSGLNKPEIWIKRLDTIPYFKEFVIHIYTKGKKDGAI